MIHGRPPLYCPICNEPPPRGGCFGPDLGPPPGCIPGPGGGLRRPYPAPAPAPDVFKITFDALRPVLTELIQKGFDAKASADRRRRNAGRVDARFEHATASLLEAARWALVMANKPGDEWKDLLNAAIQNAQVATHDVLDPEEEIASSEVNWDEAPRSPICGAKGCGADWDGTEYDDPPHEHAPACAQYAPKCSCKPEQPYLAPELHDCALGVFIRAKYPAPAAAPAPATGARKPEAT